MLTRAVGVSERERVTIGIVALALGIGAFLLVLAWGILSHRAFFTSDTGLRLLQVRALVDQQWRSFALPYPGHELDPNFEHVPYYSADHLVDGNLFLEISPFFPLFASLLYAVAGNLTLPIIPVAGAVLTGFALFRLGQLAGLKRPRLLLLLSTFGTPMFFYSLEFWDHSLAVAFAIWATYFAAASIVSKGRQEACLAGMMGALAAGQRPELYVYALALGLGLLLATRVQRSRVVFYAVGGIASALLVWLLQYYWFGHPFGPVVAIRLPLILQPESLTESNTLLPPRSGIPWPLRITRLLSFVEPHDHFSLVILLLLLCGILFMVFALRVYPQRAATLLPLATLLIILAYAGLAFQAQDRWITGVLTTFPPVALSLTYADHSHANSVRRRIYRLVLAATLLFLAIMLVLWPSHGSKQWGSRYLLVVYPLLLYLALDVYQSYSLQLSLRARSAFKQATILLFVASIVFQSVGVWHLYREHKRFFALTQRLNNVLQEVVVTTNPFLAAWTPTARDKIILYAREDVLAGGFLERLQQRGLQEVAVIARPDVASILPPTLGDMHIEIVSDVRYGSIE